METPASGHQRLRRLPKEPAHDAAAPHPGASAKAASEPVEAPKLHFERLPEPELTPLPPPPEAQPPALQKPVADVVADLPLPARRPTFPEPPAPPVTPPPPASPLRPSPLSHSSVQSALSRVEQRMKLDGATAQRASSAQRPSFAAKLPDPLTDPSPAKSRPSGVSRSRGAQPSGAFRVAAVSSQAEPAPVVRDPAGLRKPLLNNAVPPAEKPLPPVRSAETTPDEIGAESVTEVSVARTRPQSKAGAVAAMILVSVLLVLYAFEIGSLEGSVNKTVSSLVNGGSDSVPVQAFASVLPWLLVLPALALFGVIVWLLSGIIGVRRTNKRSARAPKMPAVKSPLQRFKAAADKRGIQNRTAYRTWRQLETAGQNDATITVDSTLEKDLGLTAKEVRMVHLRLLSDLQRVHEPAMRLPAAGTVMELMMAVEDAPLARNASSRGALEMPGDPGQPRRRSQL